MRIALTVVTEMLYGLHAAHEATSEQGEPLDIVHRDISPQNVIVGLDGISRVLDFGIAKAAARAHTTRDGQVKGKFAYMAPEQLTRGAVDRRADIFATSIVLWETLTGRRLFAADDHGGTIAAVLSQPIEPPSKFARDVSPDLDSIVMRGLERDPAQRFPTARAMAHVMEALGERARPAEVSAWVSDVAATVLRQRAERVAQIESTSSDADMSNTHPDAPDPTLQLKDEHTDLSSAATSVMEPKTKQRLMFAALGAVILVLASVVVVLAFRHPTPTQAPVVKAESSELPAPPAASSPAAILPSVAPPPLATVTSSSHGDARHTTPPPAVTRSAKSCSPPFYFDPDGTKHFKTECL